MYMYNFSNFAGLVLGAMRCEFSAVSSQTLQSNTHWKALFKLYKIDTLFFRSNLFFLLKIFGNFELSQDFEMFRESLRICANNAENLLNSRCFRRNFNGTLPELQEI